MKKIIVLVALFLVTICPELSNAQQVKDGVKYISVTPVVDATPYTAKDCVGGLLTFTNAISGFSGEAEIESITISDKSDNSVEYNLVFFKSTPAATFTNNSAFTPTDADIALINPIINLATTDHFSFADNGVSSLSSLNSNISTTIAGGDVKAVLYTGGTPTLAVGDITVTVGFKSH